MATKKAPVSESEMQLEAANTLQKLGAQPRVRFTVLPDGSGDRKIRVKLNGTVWEYRVGTEQEAPKDVYALVKSRYDTIAGAAAFDRQNENRDLGRI